MATANYIIKESAYIMPIVPTKDQILKRMPTFKNAIGYLRVSTEAQGDFDRYGLDLQRAEILKYADEHDYNIIEWKADKESGASDDRPAMNEIIYGDVDNPPVEAVIAFKSDRISRDTKLYYYYLYMLNKKNIELISVTEDFGSDNGMSEVYRAMVLFVAEQERKNISMRTAKGRNMKARAGGYSGGRPPLGYDIVDHKLMVNPKEAPIITRIFQMEDNDDTQYTFQEICDDLNRRGWRTKTGSRFVPGTLAKILDNRKLYEGYYKYGEQSTYVKGQHEPLITEYVNKKRLRAKDIEEEAKKGSAYAAAAREQALPEYDEFGNKLV